MLITAFSVKTIDNQFSQQYNYLRKLVELRLNILMKFVEETQLYPKVRQGNNFSLRVLGHFVAKNIMINFADAVLFSSLLRLNLSDIQYV